MPRTYSPEYAKALEALMPILQDIPKSETGDAMSRRERINKLWANLMERLPKGDDVEQSVFHVKSSYGFEIPIYHFTKQGTTLSGKAQLAVVYTHGGGYFCLSVELYTPILKMYVSKSGVRIFAMDYRLPPEHPFPTPVEDCYTALEYVSKHAKAFNVDPSRMAVMGNSAGGGLCATANLDDRDTVPGSLKALEGLATWTIDDNITGWSAYLGDKVGKDGVPSHAAPARVQSVEGLPPLYLDVPDLDTLRDEDLKYASRIAAADIETEIHLYPNVPHSFEAFAPSISLAQTAIQSRVRALQTL